MNSTRKVIRVPATLDVTGSGNTAPFHLQIGDERFQVESEFPEGRDWSQVASYSIPCLCVAFRFKDSTTWNVLVDISLEPTT